MKDRPYLLKSLMLPFLVLASSTGSYFPTGLSHNFLEDLMATFVSSILAVVNVDTAWDSGSDDGRN